MGAFYSKMNEEADWIIVEPSNVASLPECPYQYLRIFFDNQKGCELPEHYSIDTIVHSHVMEHVYEPLMFLRSCSNMLENGQVMIFSLPNMMEYMKRKYSNAIFFEHTYLITEPYIEWLLAEAGFRVGRKQYFGDGHSIFYAAVKDVRVTSYQLPIDLYDYNLKLFHEFMAYHEKMVNDLNEVIDVTDKKIYLFGAHIFTQFLLKFGLHADSIIGVLDNDPKKQGKRLYGTGFTVYSPEILKGKEGVLVIVRMGAYTEEIIDGLREINSGGIEIV